MDLTPAEKLETYRRRGWWQGDTLHTLLDRLVERTPDGLAVADPPNREEFTAGPPRRLSYRELAGEVDRVAAGFRAHGVGHDDVIMVQLPNVVELVVTILAASRMGAIVSPLPVQFRAHELRLTSALTDPVMFVTGATGGVDHRALVDEVAISSLRAKVTVGPPDGWPDGWLAWEDLDGDREAAHAAGDGVSAEEVLTVCWTSGTEAEPKGVPRSHDLWTAIAVATVDGAQLRDGDVLLTPFPLVNMSGIGGMLVPWLLTGGSLILHHPMSLPVFLRQVVAERVSYTVAPPVLLNLLLAKPEMLTDVDLSSIRTIGSGSAPLSPAMVEGWKEAHGIDVVNFFGSNEGIALVGGVQDIPDPRARARVFPRFGAEGQDWSNRVSRGMRTELVDPQTGRAVEAEGGAGELRIDGPTLFHGYWRREDLTAKAFDNDGFYRTGDLFQLEDERHLRFVGRARDLIIRGGMKVAPEEVEALLAQHPKVADIAVVGIEDAKAEGEQIVTAVVVPAEGQTVGLPELRAYLRGLGVAGYKEPRRLVVVEALPRNPLGKVLKRDLRETFSAS
ncbi:MAG: class I adenylate-forming enzyme family protein [Actinomycetota bacterium]